MVEIAGRPISHRNGWSFCVYMIPLRFRTGVKFSPRYNNRGELTPDHSWVTRSRRHDILWWYHVNKYRAMRGNRSEFAPARKSPPVSCKHPLTAQGLVSISVNFHHEHCIVPTNCPWVSLDDRDCN